MNKREMIGLDEKQEWELGHVIKVMYNNFPYNTTVDDIDRIVSKFRSADEEVHNLIIRLIGAIKYAAEMEEKHGRTDCFEDG